MLFIGLIVCASSCSRGPCRGMAATSVDPQELMPLSQRLSYCLSVIPKAHVKYLKSEIFSSFMPLNVWTISGMRHTTIRDLRLSLVGLFSTLNFSLAFSRSLLKHFNPSSGYCCIGLSP